MKTVLKNECYISQQIYDICEFDFMFLNTKHRTCDHS